MQKITPFLWYNTNAEEAIDFYVSVFKNAKKGTMARYGDAGPGPKGSVMTATFKIEDQEFIAINGGPQFKFNEAVSFVIDCKTQEEVDHYWDKLSEGGEKSRCGWLKDRFGLWWQVVPSQLKELIAGKDARRSANAMEAMMQMDKLDIRKLQEAYDK